MKNVTKLSPLQYQVEDSFAIHMTIQVNVSKTIGIGSDHYNVTAQVPEIKVRYIKTYSTNKKKFEITNVTYTFTGDMIKPTITPDPKSGEKTNI